MLACYSELDDIIPRKCSELYFFYFDIVSICESHAVSYKYNILCNVQIYSYSGLVVYTLDNGYQEKVKHS
jgi:hypothetical protein